MKSQGCLCDRRKAARVKWKVYKMVVACYDVWLGDGGINKKRLSRRGQRFSLGVTTIDKIRN